MRFTRSILACGFLVNFDSDFTCRNSGIGQAFLLPVWPNKKGSQRISFSYAAATRRKSSNEGPNDPSNGKKLSDENQSSQRRSKEEEEAILEYAIDSFLRGDYNLKLPKDNTLPPPDLGPGAVVSTALRSLRGQDLPSQIHGAAVFMRFCLPLRRSERWGDASSIGKDPWKEVLRGGLTANTLVRRIRASEFAGLLDWSRIDVTEGAFTSDRDLVGLPSIAYVNVALFFEDDSEPSLFQLKLRRVGGGAWMIDTIRRSQKDLFLETDRRGTSPER